MSNPVRVLCIFTILNRGGAETMCMNLYRNIDRRKIQFDFLVYYQERGDYEDEIVSLGGRVYKICHPSDLLRHIKESRQFFKVHKEYKIVHNHIQSNGCVICREAKKAGVKTIIYHSHSASLPILTPNVKLTIRRLRNAFLNKVAIDNSTSFFACGEAAANIFGERYPVTIIRNAINIEQYKFDQDVRYNIRKKNKCLDKLIIGQVGRFDVNKNQMFSIKVFQQLINRIQNAELWLIGDGAKKKDVKESIIQLGLENNVRLWGVRNDVNQLLQAMDVFLFPSISEGLPLSCIEAQTAGLPCVFSDQFDMHTAVTNNCKILSLTDPLEVWVEAIVKMGRLKRVDLSDEIRDAGYDIKNTAKYMEDFYLQKVIQ